MKNCEDEAVERTETFDFFLIGELKEVTENETFDAFLVGVEHNALLTLECFLFPRYDVLDFTDWNSVCADFKFWTFTQEVAHFSQMKSLFPEWLVHLKYSLIYCERKCRYLGHWINWFSLITLVLFATILPQFMQSSSILHSWFHSNGYFKRRHMSGGYKFFL